MLIHGIAILYYDYILTFLSEIDLFWSRAELSPFWLLFMLNRYIGLFGTIPVVFEYFGDFPPLVSVILEYMGHETEVCTT